MSFLLWLGEGDKRAAGAWWPGVAKWPKMLKSFAICFSLATCSSTFTGLACRICRAEGNLAETFCGASEFRVAERFCGGFEKDRSSGVRSPSSVHPRPL